MGYVNMGSEGRGNPAAGCRVMGSADLAGTGWRGGREAKPHPAGYPLAPYGRAASTSVACLGRRKDAVVPGGGGRCTHPPPGQAPARGDR